MRKEVFKVNEEDYKLIQRMKSLSDEDKQRNRLFGIKRYKIQIKQQERAIEYKRKQIKEKNSLEKHADFLDGKKPLFMLESDIEQLQFDIDNLKVVLKSAEEEYEKAKEE